MLVLFSHFGYNEINIHTYILPQCSAECGYAMLSLLSVRQ